MKKLITTLAAGLAIGSAAHAINVNFDITADGLQTSTAGEAMTSGSLFLVADTAGDSFSFLSAISGVGGIGSFLNGVDDLVLWRSDSSSFNFDPFSSINGYFSGAGSFDTADFAGLDVGDALALFWFPELGESSDELTEGMSYGVFSGSATSFSAAWEVPASSSYYSYGVYGDNGDFAGDLADWYPDSMTPAADLVASYKVAGSSTNPVPDAGPSLLLTGLALGGCVAIRRKFDRR